MIAAKSPDRCVATGQSIDVRVMTSYEPKSFFATEGLQAVAPDQSQAFDVNLTAPIVFGSPRK